MQCSSCRDHEHSLWGEIVCHAPYAFFSLAFGFIILSLIGFVSTQQDTHSYHALFHVFHYIHIMFAVVGTMITFFRFSNSVLLGVFLSTVIPLVFCVASDVVLPAFAGFLLGYPMKIHMCFSNWQDTINMGSFFVAGIISGAALLQNRSNLYSFSVISHGIHTFISSLASLFYLVSYGVTEWQHMMGTIFLLLFGAVIIPCTLSDIVVPYLFTRRHTHKDTP